MSTVTRRSLFAQLGRFVLRAGLAGGLLYGLQSFFSGPGLQRRVEERSLGLLRPPGALAEPDFLRACIRCELCSNACDTQCIRIFGAWEGAHSGTPYIVAEDRACNLCLACTEVCPSGALELVTDKAEVRMGTAVLDERICVSTNGTGACGACHTVCPFKNHAITQGLRNKPTVDAEHCVGCGLCEEACIVDERRAIRVVSGRLWS